MGRQMPSKLYSGSRGIFFPNFPIKMSVTRLLPTKSYMRKLCPANFLLICLFIYLLFISTLNTKLLTMQTTYKHYLQCKT